MILRTMKTLKLQLKVLPNPFYLFRHLFMLSATDVEIKDPKAWPGSHATPKCLNATMHHAPSYIKIKESDKGG